MPFTLFRWWVLSAIALVDIVYLLSVLSAARGGNVERGEYITSYTSSHNRHRAHLEKIVAA